MHEKERIQNAKETLIKVAHGINPFTNDNLDEGGLLNEPAMIRCLYFVSDVLENVLNGTYNRKKYSPFSITPEQKERVILPEGKIGVNEFSRCINAVLDIGSKCLTGVELNKHLKQMGILSEAKDENGKAFTVINKDSNNYGFEAEHRAFNGREYDRILINNKGKEYLLDNIEKIMGLQAAV